MASVRGHRLSLVQNGLEKKSEARREPLGVENQMPSKAGEEKVVKEPDTGDGGQGDVESAPLGLMC